MSSNRIPTLLVTGASGHLGRRVLELLLENHEGKIIAATRTPEKLAEFEQRGVIVRHADFEDQDSLRLAFEGVDRLLLISTDAVDVPGRRLNQHRNAVKAAEEARVKHVVYTSLMNPDPDSPASVAPDHLGTEEALAATHMGWTVLRENIYVDVLLFSFPQAVQTGKLLNAIGDGKAAYITREDCARAATAALSSAFEGRQILDITGPHSVSQYELADILSQMSGMEVSYIPLALETHIQSMVAAGLPRQVAADLASFDAAIARGKFSAVSSAVKDLTGRDPVSLVDFLATHRDALRQRAAVSEL